MKRLSLEERGVSVVIGFILAMSAFIAFSGFIIASFGQRAESQTRGLTDAMRQAEKRQEQLLTFVHAYENSDADELRAHFYNYGTKKITMDKLWVSGNEVSATNISFRLGESSTENNVFDVHKLTEVVISNFSQYAEGDNYPLVFLTESNALYSYMIAG